MGGDDQNLKPYNNSGFFFGAVMLAFLSFVCSDSLYMSTCFLWLFLLPPLLIFFLSSSFRLRLLPRPLRRTIPAMVRVRRRAWLVLRVTRRPASSSSTRRHKNRTVVRTTTPTTTTTPAPPTTNPATGKTPSSSSSSSTTAAYASPSSPSSSSSSSIKLLLPTTKHRCC